MLILILTMLLGSAHAAAVTETHLFSFKRPPVDFMRDVARFCLCAPVAKVDSVRDKLKITDHPSCLAEMKRIAAEWDKLGAVSAYAGHTESGPKTAVMERIEKRYGKLPGKDLAVLAPTFYSSCIVFSGPKAKEAADFVSGLRRGGLFR